MSELTQERLKHLLHYDPDTGGFTRLVRTSNSVKIGDVFFGCPGGYGYLLISVDTKLYKAHRLAWLYVHGAWPDSDIDHINGIRDDNRWGNLREATRSENMQNQTLSKKNTSGEAGVSWDKQSRKWAATITFNRRTIHLGRFSDKLDAAAAYAKAKAEIHPFNPTVRGP